MNEEMEEWRKNTVDEREGRKRARGRECFRRDWMGGDEGKERRGERE